MIGGILSTLQNLQGGFCPPCQKLLGVLCPPCKKLEGGFVHLCQNEQGVLCPRGVLSGYRYMHITQMKLCRGQHQMVLGCFTGCNFKENCLFLIYKIYLKVIKSHLITEQCFNTVSLNRRALVNSKTNVF